jgi:hypothetical protein
MKFVNKFRKSPKEKQLSALYREWDKQRNAAQMYGTSHANEIDAMFVRHLEAIESIPTK